MNIKTLLRSQAFQVLKLFWITTDLFFTGLYLHFIFTGQGPLNISSLTRLFSICLGSNIALIPIWFVSSCLNDMADPYLSVWDDIERWENDTILKVTNKEVSQDE